MIETVPKLADDLDRIARCQTLYDVIERSAARYPGKMAIACGDTTWTYSEFAAQVRDLAGALAALGIVPGERVAVGRGVARPKE